MPMMPPGSETGIYYMPIGNLHWNVTWQDLKDFTRDPRDGQGPCDVEHAEVYRSGKHSRSGGHGYVKIRGKTDFWRVYEYLNGKEWYGRCLQPDSRNAYQWIPLSDVHSGSFTATVPIDHKGAASSSSKRTSITGPISNKGSNRPSTAIMAHSSVNQNFANQNWDRGFYPPSTQIQPQHYGYQQGLSQEYPQYNPQNVETMATSGYPQSSGYVMAPINIAFMPIPESAQYPYVTTVMSYQPIPTQPIATDSQLASYASNMSLQSTTGPLVETEARKILICNLSHQVTREDIIRHVAYYATFPLGLNKDAVEDLDMPAHNDTKKRRGHAFAVLRDSFMAARCIQALDGREFMGRRLDVRLAKEGVAVPRRVEDISDSRTTRASGISSRFSGRSERRGGERERRSGKGSSSHFNSGKRNSTIPASPTAEDLTITASSMSGERKLPGTPMVVNGSSPSCSKASSSKTPSTLNWSERSVEKSSGRYEERRSEKVEGKRRR